MGGMKIAAGQRDRSRSPARDGGGEVSRGLREGKQAVCPERVAEAGGWGDGMGQKYGPD